MLDTLIQRISRRLRGDDERGASVVEYGLLIAAVAALVVVAVFAVGNWANDAFTNTCTELESAGGSPTCEPEAPGTGG